MPDRPGDDIRSLVARLYDAHGASLYRYAAMLVADPVAAEDIVHQVFTAILRQRPPLGNALHYARRAVRNECYSYLRRRRTRGEVDMPGALVEPVSAAAGLDERLTIERALRGLPAEQREAIFLHVFEGLTFREIAEETGTSINTVAARYRYALAALRRLLATP